MGSAVGEEGSSLRNELRLRPNLSGFHRFFPKPKKVSFCGAGKQSLAEGQAEFGGEFFILHMDLTFPTQSILGLFGTYHAS